MYYHVKLTEGRNKLLQVQADVNFKSIAWHLYLFGTELLSEIGKMSVNAEARLNHTGRSEACYRLNSLKV